MKRKQQNSNTLNEIAQLTGETIRNMSASQLAKVVGGNQYQDAVTTKPSS